VLHHLAKPHTTRVGADGNAKFGSHEVYGEDVIEAAHPGRVNVAVLHRTALKKLLEHDPVLTHFTSSHADA
jgi:hypothetical protein